jgi:hypothetical protein
MKGDFSRTTFDRSRHYRKVLQQQGRVHMDADWNEAQEIAAYVRETAARDTVGLPGAPSANAGFAIGIDGLATDLTISAGRLIVDGVICENDALVKLTTQPDLQPAAGALAGYPPPSATGRYLAYLDAWERHVSALLDPAIRETALGGPDTAGRAKLVWQVRLQPVGPAQSSDDFDPSWTPPGSISSGTLFAQTDPAPAGGPCVLPPLAGYRSLTNQLYRVEIHQGGWLGTPPAGYTGGTAPAFKWSRDNGTVVAAVTGIVGQSITIAQVGPDVAASFLPGQWVELVDARSELANQHGQLLLISSVAPQTGTIVIDGSTTLTAVDLTQTVLLRRWDHVGNAPGGLALTTNPISLEAGISVKFSQGGYRAGDYWTFPARTAIDAETGTIVWPGGNAPLPAQGIAHHYAPLALVDYDAGRKTFSLVEDCRTVFDPLTGRLPPFRVRWVRGGSQTLLAAGQDLPLDALQAGISVGCSSALDATSISADSVQLIADIPVTLGRLTGFNDNRVVGTQAITLACDRQMLGGNRFAVTLSQAAADLLSTSLATQFAGSARVQDFFSISEIGGSPSAWSFTPEGFLTPSGSASPGTLRSVAIGRNAVDGPLAHAGATLVTNVTATTMKAGLVFNYRSSSDFWAFYYANVSVSIGFSGGYEQPVFGVAHYLNGNVEGQAYAINAGGQNWFAKSVALDIALGQSSLNFGASVIWNNNTAQAMQLDFPKTPPPGMPAIPARIDAGTQLGVFEEGTNASVFQRLDWTRGNEQVVVVLPAGGGGRVLLRLVARPSVIRSAAQAAQSNALQLPVARTPVADFETHFWVVPTLGGYPYRGATAPPPVVSSPPPVVSSPPPIVSSPPPIVSSPPPIVSSPPPIVSSPPPIFSSGPGPIFSSGPGPILSSGRIISGRLVQPSGPVAPGLGADQLGTPQPGADQA